MVTTHNSRNWEVQDKAPRDLVFGEGVVSASRMEPVTALTHNGRDKRMNAGSSLGRRDEGERA